jgi:hypothetical protein
MVTRFAINLGLPSFQDTPVGEGANAASLPTRRFVSREIGAFGRRPGSALRFPGVKAKRYHALISGWGPAKAVAPLELVPKDGLR